jgi:hypothetical protein
MAASGHGKSIARPLSNSGFTPRFQTLMDRPGDPVRSIGEVLRIKVLVDFGCLGSSVSELLACHA